MQVRMVRMGACLGLIAALAACATAQPVARADAEALAIAMSQPFVAPELSDSGEVLSDFRPRIAPLGEGEWLYLQRNRGDAPYRQRVLQLLDQPDGSVRQVAWNLAEPEAFAAAEQDPALLGTLERAMLVASFTEGCEQVWRFSPSPEPTWQGRVDPDTCVIYSERRGKQIRIGADAKLTGDALFEGERGFDLDGTQLWGTPPGEFTLVMRRE